MKILTVIWKRLLFEENVVIWFKKNGKNKWKMLSLNWRYTMFFVEFFNISTKTFVLGSYFKEEYFPK